MLVLYGGLPGFQQLLCIFDANDLLGITINTEGIPGLKGVVHWRYPDAKTQLVYRIRRVSACGVWKAQTQKGPVFRLGLLLYLMPGSSLLSHGETPHYHRRYGVSLLSSAWGQVGPPR
ncbi:hypothetical protein AKI40_4740 [Enterobacter sp. FY-07]|nr:hypothetical protein AKI40_4740 [Enterobacter sp. FY-07]